MANSPISEEFREQVVIWNIWQLLAKKLMLTSTTVQEHLMFSSCTILAENSALVSLFGQSGKAIPSLS